MLSREYSLPKSHTAAVGCRKPKPRNWPRLLAASLVRPVMTIEAVTMTETSPPTFHAPRLKGASFETAIIERYRRRESSVIEG